MKAVTLTSVGPKGDDTSSTSTLNSLDYNCDLGNPIIHKLV